MPTAAEEANASPGPGPAPGDGDAVAVARGYFEAVAARDAAGMAAFWAPDGVGVLHGLTSLHGPEEVQAWFENTFGAIPDMRFEVIDMMADGEKVAVHWHMAGTFDGDARFEGMIANGATVDLSGCDVLIVRESRIHRNDAYLNGAQMARQLGALPAQGSAQERALTGALNLKTRITGLLGR